MDNHADIFFVNTHTKSRSGNHDINITPYEGILVFHFLIFVHLAMIGFCMVSVLSKSLC